MQTLQVMSSNTWPVALWKNHAADASDSRLCVFASRAGRVTRRQQQPVEVCFKSGAANSTKVEGRSCHCLNFTNVTHR